MSDYETELAAWRQLVDDALREENSWLALAGLYWLEAGENTFGSDPANAIVLPAGSAPPVAGSFWVEDGTVTLRVADGAGVQVNGETVQEAQLASDASGAPSQIVLGDLALILLQRGEVRGIRLWDNGRAERETFPGRQWFPVEEAFRVAGQYQRFDHEYRVQMQRRNGADFEAQPEGAVHFELGDVRCSLVAFEKPNGELHIMFSDPTNGAQTYGAGRYLTVAAPEDGSVVVDFNRAINPPCAFTDFATCPLPPAQNRLETPIPAGEKKPS